MKKSRLIAVQMIVWCIAFSGTAHAAAEVSASVQLKQAVDQFIHVMRDPALKGQDKTEQRRQRLHVLFLKYFDHMEIARKALGRHWEARSAAEQQEFASVFADLLERSYFDKIDAYLAASDSFTTESIQYENESLRRGYAIVPTKVTTAPGAIIPVDYQLKQTEGRWRICDIAIEGVSLLRNYRAQFDEILKSYSFDDLMKRLASKQE